MAKISISRETVQDLSAFYGDGFKSFLERKFQELGVSVESIDIRSLVAEDILDPGVIKSDTGDKFRLEGFAVSPGVIDFAIKRVG